MSDRQRYSCNALLRYCTFVRRAMVRRGYVKNYRAEQVLARNRQGNIDYF